MDLKLVLTPFATEEYLLVEMGDAMIQRDGSAVRKMVFERLDSRQLMAVDVLEAEPNNSESQSTVFEWTGETSVRLLGTSASKDDKDYFAFTSPSDMRVSASVASAAGAS